MHDNIVSGSIDYNNNPSQLNYAVETLNESGPSWPLLNLKVKLDSFIFIYHLMCEQTSSYALGGPNAATSPVSGVESGGSMVTYGLQQHWESVAHSSTQHIVLFCALPCH